MKRTKFLRFVLVLTTGFVWVVAGIAAAQTQPIIPGTGICVGEVGDDFENPDWSYDHRLPKVYNNGETKLSQNGPLGESLNGRWYEGQKRGQPDQVQRIETPPEGLPGSTGALLLRSRMTGGSHPSRTQQQDDFIANVSEIVGKISVDRVPSVVTRIWFPEPEHWENRSGCHFALRISLEKNSSQTVSRGRFRNASFSEEEDSFWPGMFFNRDVKTDPRDGHVVSDKIYMWMKATSSGYRIDGPEITQFGWWTLGMSVTPDGQVHYYAKPGVGDLTAEDHIASDFPFGHRAVRFRSFFFCVCSGDDGNAWSTPLVIDDSKVFFAK